MNPKEKQNSFKFSEELNNQYINMFKLKESVKSPLIHLKEIKKKVAINESDNKLKSRNKTINDYKDTIKLTSYANFDNKDKTINLMSTSSPFNGFKKLILQKENSNHMRNASMNFHNKNTIQTIKSKEINFKDSLSNDQKNENGIKDNMNYTTWNFAKNDINSSISNQINHNFNTRKINLNEKYLEKLNHLKLLLKEPNYGELVSFIISTFEIIASDNYENLLTVIQEIKLIKNEFDYPVEKLKEENSKLQLEINKLKDELKSMHEKERNKNYGLSLNQVININNKSSAKLLSKSGDSYRNEAYSLEFSINFPDKIKNCKCSYPNVPKLDFKKLRNYESKSVSGKKSIDSNSNSKSVEKIDKSNNFKIAKEKTSHRKNQQILNMKSIKKKLKIDGNSNVKLRAVMFQKLLIDK